MGCDGTGPLEQCSSVELAVTRLHLDHVRLFDARCCTVDGATLLCQSVFHRLEASRSPGPTDTSKEGEGRKGARLGSSAVPYNNRVFDVSRLQIPNHASVMCRPFIA